MHLCVPLDIGMHVIKRDCLAVILGYFLTRAGCTEASLSCNPGSVSVRLNDGTEVCEACTPGFYADKQGLTACIPCSAGYVQPLSGAMSSGNCQGCIPGTYQTGIGMGALSDCVRCPKGTFQTGLGMGFQANCTLCRAGTYQSLLGQAFQGSCILCEAGEFQTQEGAQSPTACQLCSAGKYQSAKGGGGACIACNMGFYGTATGAGTEAAGCIPCPAGTYQSMTGAVNSSACSPCVEGTYQPRVAAQSEDDCIWCPAGTYQSAPGSARITSCVQCPLGTYQPGLAASSSSDCLACGAGKYQTAAGGVWEESCMLCPAGTYQTSSVSGGPDQCIKCAVGLYQPETGASTADACIPCSAGTFQTVVGSTSGSECIMCPAGAYQPLQGAGSSALCLQCPSGTYHTGIGATTANVCVACGAGRYSSGSGMGVEDACVLCRSGTYQSDAVQGASACTKCEPGKYQVLPGQHNCTICRKGTFQPFAGVSVDWWCKECEPGTFGNISGAASENTCVPCFQGTFSSQPGPTVCQECIIGQYSPAPKSRICFNCAGGTYTNTTGASQCIGCGVGESIGVLGASACTRCIPGEFQYANSSRSCLACPPGQFQSGYGATGCFSCGEGSFQSDSNRTGCDGCLPGTFANSRGMAACNPCPKGMFQTAGNSTACVSCGMGKFQDREGQTACVPCTEGHFQPAYGASACFRCALGEFQSLNGSSVCDQCPQGSYRDETGGASRDACRNCTVGTYSNVRGATACQACIPGAFSAVTGTTVCFTCGSGAFQTSMGASGCDQCPPGTYSVEIGLAERQGCLLCATGSYAADQGQSQCDSCPTGTFSAVLGAAYCSPCRPGTFMNELGWKQDECIPCPAGTYSVEEGAKSSSLCVLCPDGFFSSAPGQSSSVACTLCKHGTVSVDDKVRCRVCGDGELCPAGYHTPIQCVPGLKCNGTHMQALRGILPYMRGNCTGAIPCPRGSKCFRDTDDNADFAAKGVIEWEKRNQTHFVVFEGGVSELPLSCPGQSLTYDSVRKDWSSQENSSHLNVLYRLLPEACPVGTYLSYDTCTPCPAGTFSPVFGALGSNTCTPCPPGSFRTSVGASVCAPCPRGGYCRTEGLTSWFACRPGTFQPDTGATTCFSCPGGTFASAARSAVCTPCKPGEYQPRTGEKSCLICETNQFSSSGDHGCSPCGSNLASLDPGFSCTPPVLPSERGGVTWITMSGDSNDPDLCLSTGPIPSSALASVNQLAVTYVLMTTRRATCITTLSVVDRPQLSKQWGNQVGRLRRPVSVRVIPFNQTFYYDLCQEQGFSVLFTVSDEDGDMTTDLTGASAVLSILDPSGVNVFFTMACARMPDDPNAKVPLGVCRTRFCPTVSVMVRVTIQGVGISGHTLVHPGPITPCAPTHLWMAAVEVIRGSVPHFPRGTFDVRVLALNHPMDTRLAVFRFGLRVLGGVTLLSVDSSYSVVTERVGDVVIVVGDASQGGGDILGTLRFRVDAATSGVVLFAQVVPQSFQFTLVNAVPYVMPVRSSGFSCRSDGYVDVLLDYPRATSLITNKRRPYVINWRRIQVSATDNPTAIHVVAVNNIMHSFGAVRATCISMDIRNFDIASCDVIRGGNVGNFSGQVLVKYQSVSSLVTLESWVPTSATFGVAVSGGGVSGRYRVRTTLSAGTRAIYGVDATPFLPALLAFGVTLSTGGLWRCDRVGRRFTVGHPVIFSAVCGELSSDAASASPKRPASFFLISGPVPGITAIGSYTFTPAVVSATLASGTVVLISSAGLSVAVGNVSLPPLASSRLTAIDDTLMLVNSGESARCVEFDIRPALPDRWSVFSARVPVFPAGPRSLDITLSTPVILAQDHSDGLDTFIPGTVFVVKAFLVFSDDSRLSVQDDARLRMDSETLDVSGLAATAPQGFSGNAVLTFAFWGIPCVSMQLDVRVVLSSVLEASLVCPECPPILSMEGDPVSQQIPASFPSAFPGSLVMVRRLLADGRVVRRSDPLVIVSGSSVTLTSDGWVAGVLPGTASLSTAFTPGQTVSITVIRRWVSTINFLCNGLSCSKDGGQGVKLAPRDDGASMSPFNYSVTLTVGLSLTLYNGSVFSSPWLRGISLLVNGTASDTFVVGNLSYGALRLGANVSNAWGLDRSHDLSEGVLLQVRRLSRLVVQGPDTLRQMHCSGFWEGGTFTAVGMLSDGTTSAQVRAVFEGRGTMVMHNPHGWFHAVSPGTGEVVAFFGGLMAVKLVSALEQSIFFTGASIDSIPSVWTGVRGATLPLTPVFTPALGPDSWFPVQQLALRVLQWTSSDPGVIEVATDNTKLILKADWYQPVILTGSFRECPHLPVSPQAVTKAITVNLAPSGMGDIDVGEIDGVPLPTVSMGGTLDIPVFINIESPGRLQSYLVDLEVAGSGLQPTTCTPGLLPNSQCAVTKNRVRYVGAFSESRLSGRMLVGKVHGTVLLDALAMVHVWLVQCVVSEAMLASRDVSYIVRLGSGPLSSSSVGPLAPVARRTLLPAGSPSGARLYGDTDGDGTFTPMDVLFMEKYMALGAVGSGRVGKVCVISDACQSTAHLSAWQLLQLKPVRNPALPASRPDGSDVLFLLLALVGKTFFLAGLDLEITRGSVRIRVDLRDFDQVPNPENAIVRVGLVTSLNRGLSFDTPYRFNPETSTVTVTCRRVGPAVGFQASSLRTSVLVDEPSVGLSVDVRSLDEWGSQSSASVADRRFVFGPRGPITTVSIMGTQTFLHVPSSVTYIPTLNCEFLCDDASLFLDGTKGAPVWVSETLVRADSLVGTPLNFRSVWGRGVLAHVPAVEPPSIIMPLAREGGLTAEAFEIGAPFNLTMSLPEPRDGLHQFMALYTVNYPSAGVLLQRVYGGELAVSAGTAPRFFVNTASVSAVLQLEFHMLKEGRHPITVTMVDSASDQGVADTPSPTTVLERVAEGIPPLITRVKLTPRCTRGVVLWSRLVPAAPDERCLVDVVAYKADSTERGQMTLECTQYPCVLQFFGYAVRPEIQTIIPTTIRIIIQRAVISVGHRSQWRLVCDTSTQTDLTVSESAVTGGLISSAPQNALAITSDTIRGNTVGFATVSFAGGLFSTGLNVTNALNPPNRLECLAFTSIDLVLEPSPLASVAVFNTPSPSAPLLAGDRFFLFIRAVYNGGYSLLLDPTPGVDGITLTPASADVIVSQLDGSVFLSVTSGGGTDMPLLEVTFQGVSAVVRGSIIPLVPSNLEVCCDSILAGPSSNLYGHKGFPGSFIISPPVVLLAGGRVRANMSRLDDSALRVEHDQSMLGYDRVSGVWTLTPRAPASGSTVIYLTYTHPKSLVTVSGAVRVTMVSASSLDALGPASLYRIHCSPDVFQSTRVSATLRLATVPNNALQPIDITDEIVLESSNPSVLSVRAGGVVRGQSVGAAQVTVRARGLSTNIAVNVVDQSVVVSSISAPASYDLVGVRGITRFTLVLNGTLEGVATDIVFLGRFSMDQNPYVLLDGDAMVIHTTGFGDGWTDLRVFIPPCPPLAPVALSTVSRVRTRALAGPGETDLEVMLTRESLTLVLVTPTPVLSFFVQIRTDAIGFTSCAFLSGMPVYSDCVFDQPFPATGEVIVAGATGTPLQPGPRLQLVTLASQSAVTSLWGLVEVFDGFSARRFPVRAGALPGLTGRPVNESNLSVDVLFPTLPVVDTLVISRAFNALFAVPRTQGVRDPMFQLALLVNRQRLVDARVYSNEFELSVMFFVMDRFLQPVPGNSTTIRVLLHTDQLDVPDSSPDPVTGGQWVYAKHVLAGWFAVELRQKIPLTTLAISFTVATAISRGDGWIWRVAAPVEIGQPLPVCPRSASNTATFLASYDIVLPSTIDGNATTFLEKDSGLLGQVACSVQVATRRVLLQKGKVGNTLRLTVALESLTRVHQANLVLMGGWLTQELQRRLKQLPGLSPVADNRSTDPTQLITIERGQLSFVNDSSDPPRPCPNGYYFSRNGTYLVLPPHSVAGLDCYDMYCLPGFTATALPDGIERIHCIPTPVPGDIVWICITVILTSVLALASLACCVKFALWTTAKDVSDVIFDPVNQEPSKIPDPSGAPVDPGTNPSAPDDPDDPFKGATQCELSDGIFFQNVIAESGMDDFSLSLLMQEDEENAATPFDGTYHGVLMTRVYDSRQQY